MEEDDIRLVMELSLDEVRQIAYSLEFHYKQWPGYPAAEKEEQERLWRLRRIFRMAMLEVSFHSDD
tara:strand:+ start:6557 stop:6754 length:198 start_codon:yes stop_codon:yes gene_type:complete